MIQDVEKLLEFERLLSQKEQLIDNVKVDGMNYMFLNNMEPTHTVKQVLDQLKLPVIEESHLKPHAYYGVVTEQNRCLPNGFIEFFDDIDKKWKIAKYNHYFGIKGYIDGTEINLENLLVRFRA